MLLVLIGVLTIVFWSLIIWSVRSMDMSMGVAVSGGMEGMDAPAAGDDMAGMPGMAMDQPVAEAIETMAASGMSGMGWSWEGFLAFLLAWVVMMAAMMFPAAAPMVLFFHAFSSRQGGEGHASAPTWIFTAGYLAVWSAIGSVAWLLIRLASDVAERLGTFSRETWAPITLGAVLVVAGVYQFSPLKQVCLRQCQTPMGFVMSHWRQGYGGAFRMGLTHGLYCLGCCWMLFAVLVAAGVMSIAWMLVLTLVVFAEKALPFGTRASQATGVVLGLLGMTVAIGAVGLPWAM